jgi:hypothetical protein
MSLVRRKSTHRVVRNPEKKKSMPLDVFITDIDRASVLSSSIFWAPSVVNSSENTEVLSMIKQAFRIHGSSSSKNGWTMQICG